MVIRKVGIWSVARMYGALSGGMGLIFGLIIAVLSAVGMTLAGGRTAVHRRRDGCRCGGQLPIFYGVLGICAGAIGGALHNVLAGIVGGVTIEVD